MAHEIKFLIPKGATVPIELLVEVDGVQVNYKRIENGFRFNVLSNSEKEALKIVNILIDRIKMEHGVNWRIVSLKRVHPVYEYSFEKTFEWHYRVRDSY